MIFILGRLIVVKEIDAVTMTSMEYIGNQNLMQAEQRVHSFALRSCINRAFPLPSPDHK
jgi:hypothetical protein